MRDFTFDANSDACQIFHHNQNICSQNVHDFDADF